MSKKIILPSNRSEWLTLRSKNINSTDVSALFGISPYSTKFELWHKLKSGYIVDIEETERMRWGTRLQSAIAKGIGEDEGWTVEEFPEYVYLPDEKLGSSFDYKVKRSDDTGILEIKNVDSLQFKENWIMADGILEAPPHIEIQVQHQMMVSGYSFALIGALIGGNKVILLERHRDEEIIENIRERCRRFWKSIDENKEPDIDWRRDSETVIGLNQSVEPNKIVDLDDEESIAIAKTYKQLSDSIKTLENKKIEMKAKLLERIKDAEKAIGPDFSISAGYRGEAEISYTKEGFRDFRIHWKKSKATT